MAAFRALPLHLSPGRGLICRNRQQMGVWEFHVFTGLFSSVRAPLNVSCWVLPLRSGIAALSYSYFIISFLLICISFFTPPPILSCFILPSFFFDSSNLQSSVSLSTSSRFSLFIDFLKPTTWWGSVYSFMLHPAAHTPQVAQLYVGQPHLRPFLTPSPPPAQTALLSAGSRVLMTSPSSPPFFF